jgi:hypothetical protein
LWAFQHWGYEGVSDSKKKVKKKKKEKEKRKELAGRGGSQL